MKIILTKMKIFITNEDNESKFIMERECSLGNGMHLLNMIQNLTKRTIKVSPTNYEANSIYDLRKQKDIIDFLGQSMWNPVL